MHLYVLTIETQDERNIAATFGSGVLYTNSADLDRVGISRTLEMLIRRC